MDLHSEVGSFSDNHALVTGAASSGEQKAACKSRLVRGSYLDEVVNREEEGKEQHEASKQKDEPALSGLHKHVTLQGRCGRTTDHILLIRESKVTTCTARNKSEDVRGASCCVCLLFHLKNVAATQIEPYLTGNRMRWRKIMPVNHRGNKYTFQFQGSDGASWKQRRKLSSTTAEAASCTRGLISRSSSLLQSDNC